MQTDRAAFINFLVGALWPFVAFVLFLSIGLNAFFLTVDRFRQASVTVSSSSSSVAPSTGNGSDAFARGPQAFGKVWRGFPVRPQRAVAGVPLAPVKTYEFSPEVLPTIPAKLTLYRDQGIDIDPTFIQSVFSRFGSPLTAEPGQYFARVIGLKSANATTDVTLDVDRRVLTVIVKKAPPAPAQPTRADDAEVIALAKQFASTIGVDASTLGTPAVLERTDNGTSRTIVTWNATFAGFPLFDMNMQPVHSLEVQVGRVSHRALAAWVSLLKPELLTHSEYPAATRDLVSARLGSGGFLPVAKDLPGKGKPVTYSSAVLGYVVQPGDSEFPLYVIPVIRASWMAELTCKGCVPQEVATFVPALDTKTFSWSPEQRPPAEPLVPKPDPSGESPAPVVPASKPATSAPATSTPTISSSATSRK